MATKPPPPLKTPVAWGADGNRIYAEDITQENVAHIKSKLPRDFDGNDVVPNVGSEGVRAHFVVTGNHFSGKGLHRKETSQRHGTVQRIILQHLKKAKNKIDVFTGGPVNSKTQWRPDVLKISLLDGCDYQWVEDPETRIWMNSIQYLKPDIAGRDISRFAASPRYPSILIEVVHHHWPDPETWDALVALSRRNHFVAFYVVDEADLVWKMNAYKTDVSGRMHLRVQIYLQDGVLYDGDEVAPIHGSNAIEQQTSALNYLSRVKEKYVLEQKKKDEYMAEKKKQQAQAQQAQDQKKNK